MERVHTRPLPAVPGSWLGGASFSAGSDSGSEPDVTSLALCADPDRDIVELVPDDCWLHIFTFLPSWSQWTVSGVCAKFRELLLGDTRQWTSFDVGPWGYRMSSADVRRVLCRVRGRQLKTVNLSGCIFALDSHVALLASPSMVVGGVTTLNLSWCEHLTDESMFAVAQYFPVLGSIDISHCRAVTSLGAHALASLPFLRSLTAGCCYKADETWTKAVSVSKSLERVNVRHCIRIPPGGFLWLGVLPRLKVLVMRGCSMLTDEALLYVLNMCMGLEELDVGGCKHINATMADITRWLATTPPTVRPCLRSLCVRNCYQMDDTFLALLLPKFPNLRTLDLTNCFRVTNAGLATVAAECSQLADLSLGGCRKLTAEGIERLCRNGGLTLSNICLDLCVEVGIAAIKCISLHCENLNRLSLCHCYQVTDDYLRTIAQGTGAKRLKELLLSHCFRVTDAGVVAISLGCPSLRVLNITGCTVGLPGVCAVVHGCRNLLSLVCDLDISGVRP